MKILQISPYTTCNNVPLLSQCKSGFGYMTYDIAHALAKESEVDELLYNYRYKEFEQGGIRFVANTFGLFLKNIFKCSNPLIPLKLWWKYRMQLRTFVRLVYIWLISGHVYDVIKKGNYDIVHIHGCGIYDEVLMNVCRRANQKFVVTLHGLNSFSDSVIQEKAEKCYERDFLQRVVDGEFPITVISTGIKRIIETTYSVKNISNLFVVCNAFSFSEGGILDIRKKYGIPAEAKILLYVGNISKNKNQEQMIEAYGQLSKKERQSIYVLFLGRNLSSDYTLNELVASKPFSDHLVLCGNVDKQYMGNYYIAADGVVLLSYAEGFGLSLIEGMHFGKPCMTFADLDAFEDIYDDCAVIGLKERTDEAVAKGTIRLLETEWSSKDIMAYSKKFESRQMADNYIRTFKRLIH